MTPRLRRGVPGTQRHGTFARPERTEPIRSQQLEDQRTILCISHARSVRRTASSARKIASPGYRIRAADSSDQDVGTQEENGRCPSTAGQALEFSKGTRAQDSYRVPQDSTNTRTAPSVSDE